MGWGKQLILLIAVFMQLSILNKVALSLHLANMLFITDLEFSGYAVRYLRPNVTQAWKVIIIIHYCQRKGHVVIGDVNFLLCHLRRQ